MTNFQDRLRHGRGEETGSSAKSRRRVALPAVVLLVAVGASVFVANPRFPFSPELSAISLEIPQTQAPTPRLRALLKPQTPTLYSTLPSELEPDGVRAVKNGEWMARPTAVVAALSTLRPTLDEVGGILRDPGCLPQEQAWQPAAPNEVAHVVLVRAAKLLGLREVTRAQNGDPDGASLEVISLLNRFTSFEQQCAPQMITTMIVRECLTHLQFASALLLSHPRLKPELRDHLWEVLFHVARRNSIQPDAIRWERHWRNELIRNNFGQGKKGEKPSAVSSWPWYDQADTLRVSDAVARRSIWLAGQPLSSDAWRVRYPEESYFEALGGKLQSLAALRFNSEGRILVGLAAPAVRKLLLRWHRLQCLEAARLELWSRQAAERQLGSKVPLPPELRNDPFTREPFPAAPRATVCNVPESFLGRDDGLKGELRVPFPSPPPVSR